MNKTLAFLNKTFLMLLLAGLNWMMLPEKAYAQDKDIQQLIQDLNHDDDRIRADAAMHLSALAAESTDAVEAVPALIKALGDSEEQVWFHSITALSRLGPDAALAIPELINDLREKRSRGANAKWYRSAYALGQIGEAAIKPLIEACENSRSSVRAGAAKALEWIPEASNQTVPILINLLGDDDEDVREISANSLSLLPEPSFELLKSNIDHNSDLTRKAIYIALGKMGHRANGASKKLLEQLQSEKDVELLSVAVESLANIGADQESFLPFLESIFDREEDQIQQATANAILSLSPAHSVPSLIQFLNADDESIKSRAAHILGHMGPSGAPALNPLIEMIINRQANPEKAKTYQKAFVAIGLKGIPVLLDYISKIEPFSPSHWATGLFAGYGMMGVSSLEKSLETNESKRILAVMGAFALMGPNAIAAEQSIVRMTHHESAPIRSSAVQALTSIGIKPAKLSPLIEPLLNDKSLSVRQSAVASLRKSPEAAANQLSKLNNLLNDSAAKMRENALLAIASTGNQAVDLAEEVAMLLADPTPDVRLAAISTLGSIGTAPGLAIRQMNWLARHSNDIVLLRALKAMGSFGDRSLEYLPLFESNLNHANEGIRQAAFGGYIIIEKKNENLIPVMTKALGDEMIAIRHASLRAMGTMREDAAAAIPNLIARLDHDEDQDLALGALRSMPSKIEFIGAYMASLDHEDPSVRHFGCRALGRLGKDATSALPKLKEARRDRYSFVRDEAKKSIDRIED